MNGIAPEFGFSFSKQYQIRNQETQFNADPNSDADPKHGWEFPSPPTPIVEASSRAPA